MTPSLEGWPTKDKEATSPNDVRLPPAGHQQYLFTLQSCLTSKIWKKIGQTTKKYLSAANTVMLLLNRNNKDLHCKEVLLLNEYPFEHTKLQYI